MVHGFSSWLSGSKAKSAQQRWIGEESSSIHGRQKAKKKAGIRDKNATFQGTPLVTLFQPGFAFQQYILLLNSAMDESITE